MPAPELAAELTTRGETIYIGSSYPLGTVAAEPTFVYERRVGRRGEALEATHVTHEREPAGAIAIAESATYTAGYELFEYTLHANQLGQKGSVRVEKDQVFFERVDDAGARSHVEHQPGAVVVGPTLVGYIFRRLDELRGGKRLPVRLAVLERLETIGFELQAVEAKPGETRVRMKAASFLIGLIVDPVYFTFETATGKLVRLEGRIPPKVREGDRWRDFDARVEYRFVAAAYR